MLEIAKEFKTTNNNLGQKKKERHSRNIDLYHTFMIDLLFPKCSKKKKDIKGTRPPS